MLEHTLSDTTNSVAVPLNENNNYWSSSEYSQNNAYKLNSNNGNLNNNNKNNNNLVRAFCLLPHIWNSLLLPAVCFYFYVYVSRIRRII